MATLAQRSGPEFVIIENGEAWMGSDGGGKTIVFLDADRNILSFGCG